MSTAQVDYAHTREAEQNRIVKARAIARYAFDHSLPVEDLTAALHQGDNAQLARIARAADVAVPGTLATWQAAIDALTALEAWAADPKNHAHTKATRTPKVAPEPVVEPVDDLAPVLTLSSPVQTPSVDAPPRGWGVLAALGPVDRTDARCARDRRPAITTVRVVDGPDEWRCASCPPAPGEWGHALDWTPRDPDHLRFHPDARHRCYDARCPRFVPNQQCTPMSASALLDERAAAAGKNRAPVHVRQAAVAAVNARRAHQKELRTR